MEIELLAEVAKFGKDANIPDLQWDKSCPAMHSKWSSIVKDVFGRNFDLSLLSKPLSRAHESVWAQNFDVLLVSPIASSLHGSC